MNLREIDRSTGWISVGLGVALLAWTTPPLWSFFSTGSSQFVFHRVQLAGNNAAIAAGILAASGMILTAAGLTVLIGNRT